MGCSMSGQGKPYHPPQVIQLRLEAQVAQATAKWWKVEDWLTEHPKPELTDAKTEDHAYALRDFIVKLIQEK